MVCLGEFAIRYLDYAREKFVVKTYQEKVAVFRRLFQVFDKEAPVSSITPGRALAFLQSQKVNRSGYAANKDRKNLLAAWAWAFRYIEGFPQGPSPFFVDRFSEERQTRYVPPESDFWKAYHACITREDQVFLLALLHTAARRGEIFRLTWGDVNFDAGTIRLTMRKNRQGTWESSSLPITEDLKNALLDLHRSAECGDHSAARTDFVFSLHGEQYCYRQHFMKRLCKRAGVPPFGFHAIRHLTASCLAQAGVPMVQIQAILRHKNLSTTERYIRGLESVRGALDFLPSLKKNHHDNHQDKKKT